MSLNPAQIDLMRMPFSSTFTRDDVLAVGADLSELRHWLRRGEAVRIGTGLYAPPWCPVPKANRACVDGQLMLSFVAAAKVHGLQVPRSVPAFASSPLRLDRLHRNFMTTYERIQLPTADWTAVNLARHQTLPQALIPLDSALRLSASSSRLEECLQSIGIHQGRRDVHEALRLSSGLSESALESHARGVFILADIPLPTQQAQIGKFRVDFYWPAQHLVVETDGMAKYDSVEKFRQEKLRHSALNSLGVEVLRCLWADVEHPNTAFIRTLERRLS